MPTCTRCGANLGEGRLAGLCPRCMMRDALGDAADPLADIAEVAAPKPAPHPSPSPGLPPSGEGNAIPGPSPSGQKELRPGPGRHALEVRCPQCGHLIELAPGAPLSGVCCASCGTRFNIIDEAAVAEAGVDLGKIGPFEILEKLGSGSFGTVWKARDSRLDRLVAIKVPVRRSEGRDNEIRIWDVPSGQLRSVLSEMQTGSGLNDAAFSHDSRTLASGEPTRAKIWNVASGRLLMTFKGLGRSAFGPLFSPDGNTLLIGGSRHPSLPGPIRLLHAPSFAEIEQAEHAGGSVAVLAPE